MGSQQDIASRTALVQAVYEEIVVRGEEFVKVRLTQDAYGHGFALALPAQVSVLAAWIDESNASGLRWRNRHSG